MPSNTARRVILVVEDEALVRDLIAQALRDAGWEVLESHTAEAAIGYLLEGRAVDVVFTDIQLAGSLSGWDLADECKAVCPEAAVLYTSGNAADRSRRVEGSLFFDKPYWPDDILRACRRLSDRDRD